MIDFDRESHRRAGRGCVYAAAALLSIPVLFAMIGCQVLDAGADRAADRAAQGLAWYCENTDDQAREQFRARLNERAAPHSLTATCGQ